MCFVVGISFKYIGYWEFNVNAMLIKKCNPMTGCETGNQQMVRFQSDISSGFYHPVGSTTAAEIKNVGAIRNNGAAIKIPNQSA